VDRESQRVPPKKLIEAAEHWARGGRESTDEALADLEAFGGAPPDVVASLSAEPVELEIDPENWETVMAFLRVQTQWVQGPGGATGLNYPAVFATLDRLKIADPAGAIFDGLQVMERAVLKAAS